MLRERPLGHVGQGIRSLRGEAAPVSPQARYFSAPDTDSADRLAKAKEALALNPANAYPLLLQIVSDPQPWRCAGDDLAHFSNRNIVEEALAILRALTPEQKAEYERTIQGSAQRDLKDAIAADNLLALFEVARKYRTTAVGKEAAEAYIRRLIDYGRFEEARYLAVGLQKDFPAESFSEPMLALFRLSEQHGTPTVRPEMGRAAIALFQPPPTHRPLSFWSKDSHERVEILQHYQFIGDLEHFPLLLGENFPAGFSACDFFDLPDRLYDPKLADNGLIDWMLKLRNYSPEDVLHPGAAMNLALKEGYKDVVMKRIEADPNALHLACALLKDVKRADDGMKIISHLAEAGNPEAEAKLLEHMDYAMLVAPEVIGDRFTDPNSPFTQRLRAWANGSNVAEQNSAAYAVSHLAMDRDVRKSLLEQLLISEQGRIMAVRIFDPEEDRHRIGAEELADLYTWGVNNPNKEVSHAAVRGVFFESDPSPELIATILKKYVSEPHWRAGADVHWEILPEKMIPVFREALSDPTLAYHAAIALEKMARARKFPDATFLTTALEVAEKGDGSTTLHLAQTLVYMAEESPADQRPAILQTLRTLVGHLSEKERRMLRLDNFPAE